MPQYVIHVTCFEGDESCKNVRVISKRLGMDNIKQVKGTRYHITKDFATLKEANGTIQRLYHEARNDILSIGLVV